MLTCQQDPVVNKSGQTGAILDELYEEAATATTILLEITAAALSFQIIV
ncbi:hypothetical protein [Clostridium pasteurianum]|nr:hypothetical protein [Clostridium pasteurianum]